MMNEQEQKEFAMKAGQNLCNELSKRGVIMSDEEMKEYRKIKKHLDFLKNNKMTVKRCGELLIQSSEFLDNIIKIYENPLSFFAIMNKDKMPEYMAKSLECIELSAKGISTLGLYNEIQMKNISIEDEKEEE